MIFECLIVGFTDFFFSQEIVPQKVCGVVLLPEIKISVLTKLNTLMANLQDFQWYNCPPSFKLHEDGLGVKVRSTPRSDFWQKTHYEFVHDTGNFLFKKLPEHQDFIMSVDFSGNYQKLYDQAGLMVRFDSEHWLKTGIELFDDVQHMSAVFTNGHSDWSVVRLLDDQSHNLTVRVKRKQQAFTVEYLCNNEHKFRLLRLGYLLPALKSVEHVEVGIMVASPTSDDGFETEFRNFSLTVL